MKNKKRVMLGTTLVVLLLLGGVIWMNNGFGDWSERNREEIEENVKRYVARYKLDPDKVEIVSISDPIKYPTGEEDFNVYIRYYGDPYITVDLYGNTDTLSIRDPDERIATSVFNELYLQARYEELSPTIDYLKSQGIVDPLRPESEQIQFFRTNVGINSQINEEIREAYKIGDDLKNLKAYIDTNLDKIIRLDTNIRIVGEREEIDEADAAKIEEELKTLLPRSNYYAEIGVRDISTGESKDLFKMIRVP